MNTERPDDNREPQAACMVAGLAALGAATCLATVVWTTYYAFDHRAFDLLAAIVAPIAGSVL
jgi:hypothetical protein